MTAAFQLDELLQPGAIVDGRYRVGALLGSGGMASVYRGTHLTLDQPVAIKVISPQIRALPGIARRFLREARAATRLKSPHVVRVFDVGVIGDLHAGAPYMVMELLEGQDLSDALDERGPLETEAAAQIVLQACEGLAEVHGHGIVHRDLKPANLFLATGTDGLPIVKIIDFGISRLGGGMDKASMSMTQPEQVMGSPKYMSPEQMESAAKVDARSDIWGLGIVLYETITGSTPFDGESYWDIYLAAKKGAPTPMSELREGVPDGLDDVVRRCLAPERAERYRDVAELAEALAPFAGEHGPTRAESTRRVLEATRLRVSDAPAPVPAAKISDVESFVRRRVKPSEPPKEVAETRSTSPWGFAITFVIATLTTIALAGIARPWLAKAAEDSRAASALAPDPTTALPPLGSGSVPPARPSLVGEASVPKVIVPPATANLQPTAPMSDGSGVVEVPIAELPTIPPAPAAMPFAPRPMPDDKKLFEDRK